MERDWTVLTVKEVASQMTVTSATVRKWISQKKLLAIKQGQYKVLKKDLEAFMEARLNKWIEARLNKLIQKVGK